MTIYSHSPVFFKKTTFKIKKSKKMYSHLFRLLVHFMVSTYLICSATTAGARVIHTLSGKTMGTFYHVKIVEKKNLDLQSLKKKIDLQLNLVNQSMSVYDPKSEISRFNTADNEKTIPISHDFMKVMQTAARLYKLTEGAWDGTVKPLVDLWGFGTKAPISILPGEKTIRNILEGTGFHNIEIQKNGLKKKTSIITLDLGSIAKGYGVDAVTNLLDASGYTDFIVEIGGEIMTRGEKHPDTPWTVGISRPEKKFTTSLNQAIYRALPLKNKAMATSGDYRNFTTINGTEYSHIIDPVTGWPVTNGVVSATVISDTCTFADGLATALMVMDPEKGIKLVNTINHTDCLILVQDKKGSLKNYFSASFPK